MIAVVGGSIDLFVGIGLMAALTVVAYWIGRQLAQSGPRSLSLVFGVSVLVGTLVFAVTLLGRLSLARLVPWSNAMVVTNLVPLGGGFLSGFVAGQTAIPGWRRNSVAGILICLSWYTVARDLLPGRPLPERPRFLDGLAIQTTPASCSPCSAVIMLMHHGIPASERELMDLCLTRYDGTPELGLYRGLKLKTSGTDWTVQVIAPVPDGSPPSLPTPALLLVDAAESLEDPGWPPSAADHAVVLFGFTNDGRARIADPSAGYTLWSSETLQRRWHGAGLCLKPAPTTATAQRPSRIAGLLPETGRSARRP